VHLPYPPPQLQVCFLFFPITSRDSHHSFTDPKRKVRKPSHLIPLISYIRIKFHHCAGHNQPIIILSCSPTALITMHNVKRFLEDSTHVSHILCFLLSPKPKNQKMQLRTLSRSPRPRHRRRQPQTRRPHRHLPQTHHDRQQREGNSHTAHLFRGGLCRGAVQVWHGRVGEGGKWNEPRQLFHNGVYSFFCRTVACFFLS
jgi:hypothetical protein